MRSKTAALALSGLLACMVSVVWAQNSNTATNSNANANRRGGNPYNGIPCSSNATSNMGCDPNAGWSSNAAWNSANFAANAVNAMANVANVAANAPRKTRPRKKRARRPTASLGGAFTLENSILGAVAAGVS